VRGSDSLFLLGPNDREQAVPYGGDASSAASIPRGLRVRHPAAGGMILSGYI
jgi:hypothetical protein